MSFAPQLSELENGGAGEKDVCDFDCHYRASSKTVRDVLAQMLDDMSTYKTVHNWDKKLVISPLEMLARAVRGYLNSTSVNLNPILVHSSVDEVLTVDGTDRKYPAIQHPGDIDAQLFFTHTSSDEEKNQLLRHIHRNFDKASEGIAKSRSTQGRIVYLDEHAAQLDRAALLMLFVFSVRFQNEDKGYLNAFIERHLHVRYFLKVPSQWQERSPPEWNASRQISYQRVSSSFHITYLMLNTFNGPTNDDAVDRTRLFPVFRSADKKNSDSKPRYLYKSTSSVLLTLAIPRRSTTREEHLDLLKGPEGLWTVLIVNCSMSAVPDQEASHYLTPIAQYVRGITSSLRTQRTNAEAIYDVMKDQIRNYDNVSLFDDEHFTISTLYHWTIKTCNELQESIASTLRFVRRACDKQLKALFEEAHPQEKQGVEFWKHQMEDEIFALEDLQTQVIALNSQVQESRNALHGVTAVLNARIALQQGDRVKTLAYLATLYLPLTATAALYSMSVLPTSASFPSFFIVLAIFLLITIFIGLHLSTFLSNLLPPLLRPFRTLLDYSKQHECLRVPSFIQKYIDLLNPAPGFDFDFAKHPESIWGSMDPCLYNLIKAPFYLLRRGPADIVHYRLVREIFFLRDLYVMSRYRGNVVLNIKWRWTYFVRDIVRAILLPVWVVMIVVTVGWLIVLDLVILVFVVIFSLVALMAKLYHCVR